MAKGKMVGKVPNFEKGASYYVKGGKIFKMNWKKKKKR